MSTGMRWKASTEASATAMSAMTTVTGRRSASKTNRILFYSLLDLIKKRLNVPGRYSRAQHGAPHTEARKGIVDLRLREQALRISHVNEVSETGLITCRCLLIC